MLGQTSLSRLETKGWWTLMTEGGMIRTRADDGTRTGNRYLVLDDGIGNFIDMNFVDGYQVGPEMTLGRMFDDYSRLELDVDVKWTFSRECWAGMGALRYVFKPQDYSWLEVFAGQKSLDYDSEPFMPVRHQSLAGSLFGWNDGKLLLRTMAGMRGSIALGGNMQMGFGLWYELREREWPHQRRSIFKIKAQNNVPRLYGHPVEDWKSDPLLCWDTEHLMRVDVSLQYTPGRVFYITNDFTTVVKSPYPTFLLQVKAAAQSNLANGLHDVNNISVDLSIEHSRQWVRHENLWRYKASVGYFPLHRHVNIADMRHFDASTFLWQVNDCLTHFALLTNYELSTARAWIEAHGEWSGEEMLLSRITKRHWLRDYVQLHVVKTEACPMHTELTYGIDVSKKFRMGLSAGFDDDRYDGTAFTLQFDF